MPKVSLTEVRRLVRMEKRFLTAQSRPSERYIVLSVCYTPNSSTVIADLWTCGSQSITLSSQVNWRASQFLFCHSHNLYSMEKTLGWCLIGISSTGELLASKPKYSYYMEVHCPLSQDGFFGDCTVVALSTACSRNHLTEEFHSALEGCIAEERPLRGYYQIQSLQTLGQLHDQVSVPVWIARGQTRS